jgi:hypothetical protein
LGKPTTCSLDVLLSSLFGTWLQHPYFAFSSRLAWWIASVYDAHSDPALIPPADGVAQDSYVTLSRAIPSRLRQMHVDMVHDRIFMLAYPAYVQYNAIARSIDEHAVAASCMNLH